LIIQLLDSEIEATMILTSNGELGFDVREGT